MTGLVKMLGRVLVLGRIAAADMATLETQPQVHPGVVHFEALLAALAARFHLFDVLLMSTSLSHGSPHNFLNAANPSCTTASAANVWKQLGWGSESIENWLRRRHFGFDAKCRKEDSKVLEAVG